ncbi:UDP-N-acetylmuramate dehydrogenase [Halieaceae bacterium]|nr:UDP-N-acetylmuramate dehydrogenase [Halieaceae bacterium]
MPIEIQENIDLEPYNTLGVPCKAYRYCEVYSEEQIGAAIAYARPRKLDILVLGHGSNVVLEDNWPGLVLRQCSSGWTTLQEDDESVTIRVAAGENWHQFVYETLTRGFYGLENLALIPGTVGAAPIQNIGAYGVEVEQYITDVSYVDIHSGKTRMLSAEGCEFAYRDSIFKQVLRDKVVISSVTFKLQKKQQLSMHYPALFNYFEDSEPGSLDSWSVFNAVVAIRSEKLPDPDVVPNVGSFFRNPVINQRHVEELLKVHADMPVYDYGKHYYKIPAAWLIENCGWKGRGENGIEMHANQALVLTNKQHRSGREILDFARQVADSVYRRFDISLELEPVVYP